MRDKQVFLNLFNQTPYLLVSVIGETLVIISGGIDLSVAGIVPLVTTASASLLRIGWDPWLVMLLMLAIGTAMGAIMGYFITYMKVQPFIGTLAGMWIGRGLAYFISNNSISINNRIYELLSRTKILIPGLSDPVTQKGAYITPSVIIGMIVFSVAILIAQYTRFGRTIYAMGGNNGANEQAAKIDGIACEPNQSVGLYINGFCSAFAGILLSIYTGSGHGVYGTGMEMTVIAAVVIGGTAFTGGQGYVFGAIFGTLITILIQTMIQIQGTLISWWTLIVVGCNYAFLHWYAGIFCQSKNWSSFRDKESRKEADQAISIYSGSFIRVIALVILAINIFDKPDADNACQDKTLQAGPGSEPGGRRSSYRFRTQWWR